MGSGSNVAGKTTCVGMESCWTNSSAMFIKAVSHGATLGGVSDSTGAGRDSGVVPDGPERHGTKLKRRRLVSGRGMVCGFVSKRPGKGSEVRMAAGGALEQRCSATSS